MSQGVVVFKPYKSIDYNVRIYNQTGKLIRHFEFKDEADKNPTISPSSYSAEYSVLIFDCVGQTAQYYKVIIDEGKKQIGYIRKNDPNFHFQTWAQHIVSVATVEFDDKQNPLHRQPRANSPAFRAKNQSQNLYHPKQVVGDWLRVNWDESPKGSGWILWRNKQNELLVGLLYVM